MSRIDNVFSFSFFEWDKFNSINGQNNHFLKKNNIFFAENGNGKSALVSVFKSLNGNGQVIELEKNWDRPLTDDQKVEILLRDNSQINFLNSVWTNNSLINKFLIFDEFYIDKYVHSVGPVNIDTIQRKHQRGQNIVYLGNFDSYYNEIEVVNSLKKIISDKNDSFIKNEETKLKVLLSIPNIPLEQIVKDKRKIINLKKNKLKPKKINLEDKKSDLEKINHSIKQKNTIGELLLLSKISSSFSLEIELGNNKKSLLNPISLFSFTVSVGVKNTLHKIYHKKDFIKHGISLLTDEETTCPFCEQKIKNGEYYQIIKDYQKIFDQKFAIEEQNVKLLLSKYKEILSGLRDFQPPTGNIENLNKAKKFLSLPEELLSLNLSKEEKQIINQEIDLVSEKESKILETVKLTKVNLIKKIIIKLNKLIQKYNDEIQGINRKISTLKNDSVGGKLINKKSKLESEIKDLEKEIFFIENKDKLLNYFTAENLKRENDQVIESLERIYQKLKVEIIKEFNAFVSNYFGLIKKYVAKISPSMKILEIAGQASLDRRSSHDQTICGFQVKYNNKDCTKNLSQGEKQVIALAYFFAQLKKENNDKIIVLDDPITSFDAGKRKSTAEVIEKETKQFSQLFILTCDPLFREYCLKQLLNNRNFYYIFKTLGSSSIHYVPKNRETIYASFETDFRDIQSFSGTNENVVIFGQKLRFCLETKIKEDYFAYSRDKLSDMINQVASNGRNNLVKIIDNKDIILQIYNYCNTGGLAHYPRDGSTSWNELKDKIKQYLDLNL